jgi:stage II sporulation protein R
VAAASARGHPGRLPGKGAASGRTWVALGGLFLATAALLALARGWVLTPASLGPTLRLRVVAASNAPADQRAKLAVRDAVLAVLAPAVRAARTPAAAEAAVRSRLPLLRRVAGQAAAVWHEPVAVRLGRAPFPPERLGWLVFPAGSYPALVVTLGPGRGHNWWTVLFPPLALVTVGGHLAVVGPPAPGGALTPSQRQEVLRRLGGQVTTASAYAPAGVRVQVRFALWVLGRTVRHALSRAAPARWLRRALAAGGARRPGPRGAGAPRARPGGARARGARARRASGRLPGRRPRRPAGGACPPGCGPACRQWSVGGARAPGCGPVCRWRRPAGGRAPRGPTACARPRPRRRREQGRQRWTRPRGVSAAGATPSSPPRPGLRRPG